MAKKTSLIRSRANDKPLAIDGVPVKNEILLNLPPEEQASIFPELVFVELRTLDVLHEAGERIKFAYFINGGLASVLSVMVDGKSVEVGLTGKEGFVGLPLIVGLITSPTVTVIQVNGSAFRIGATGLVRVLRRCATLEKKLQRYVQILAMQGTHVAACNRLHEVDERLGAVVVDEPGSDRLRHRAPNLGVSCPHAGNEAFERQRGGRCAAEGRIHHLHAGIGPD